MEESVELLDLQTVILFLKIKYAKDEKKNKKNMHCDCHVCFNTACDICM